MAAPITPFVQDVPSATDWKTGAVPLVPQIANCLPSALHTMVPGEEQVLPEEEPEVESVDGEAAPAAAGAATEGAAAAAGEAATEGAAAAAAAGEAAEGAAGAGEATDGAAEEPAGAAAA